jgi:hypothetical protein
MTVQEIILSVIQANSIPFEFKNYDIENKIPDLAIKSYNIFHTPGTYSREFRKMRKNGVFAQHGYELKEISKRGAKDKIWKIDLLKSP